MKKLISMTDFVLEKNKAEEVTRESYIECRNYANFLKQPLTLGMFVPCDENGNVLEEKKPFQDDYHKFQQAKERVIFEGFDYWRTKDIFFENKTIEDLIPYNLILTNKI
jgi:hypothetical protein